MEEHMPKLYATAALTLAGLALPFVALSQGHLDFGQPHEYDMRLATGLSMRAGGVGLVFGLLVDSYRK